MEGVVENFSVVDSMPMISEEPESAGHIIATVTNKDSNGQQITIINDVESTIKSRKSGSMEEQTHTIHAAKSEEQIIPEAMTQIITTSEGTHIIAADGGHEHQSPQIITASDGSQIFAHKDGHIISTDTGQIMTHEISNDGQIFTNSGGELITDETSHIIMNDGSITTDGRGNILHAGGQVITENGKAHILSADGEVIAVDSSLLEGAHDLQEHVTEVIEETAADEEAALRDPLLRRIKKEPEDPESATIQIRVNASSPRKKDVSQSVKEKDDPLSLGEFMSNERPTKYARVDRDDPRSRLHFVKYMKREGKTIKVWECGICGKEFMHQYTLMRHLPTHTDERNFRCNQCGKAFRQMSTLSQHKATHSESRPYVCDICQKTFSRVSTLISHKKTHTEEKQHRCHVCGKAFHQKGNLKNHLFTHTNERPYKCDICGRGFNQSSNLQCHKAKSHADGTQNYQYIADKYKCNYCEHAFARRAQLRQHEEYKHGVRHSHGSRIMSGTGPRMISNNNALLKKRKIGNVRIIQLPNGDRTFQEIGTNEPIARPRKVKPKSQVKSGILIEPIDTKAMHRALAAGRTPFALLKPSKGVPVVVKVQFALGSKHMLVPASAAELRNAGKFTVSSQQCGTKAVQIKVPVVATVIQRIDADGQVHMDIEAPAEDEDLLDSLAGESDEKEQTSKIPSEASTSAVTSADNGVEVNQQLVMNPAVVQPSITEPVMEGEEEDHSVDSSMPAGEEGIIIGPVGGPEPMGYAIDQDSAMASGANEGGEDINSVDLLATAVNLVSQAQMTKDSMAGIEGIQYLRQMNLGEYEVVSPDHAQATHIMNQHGQIEQIKMVDESNTVTMEQANISALMDALQSAGYQIGPGNQQIIINADGHAMVVDQQQVQMVIDGDMEGVIASDGVVTDAVDPASVNLVVHEVPEGIQTGESDTGS
ncbi:uncharacterized protein LOC119586810 isoform X1 [Penaeus monodon]|uniref:uncharacterized protein LOC119586810 isoform X1 n=1 Tax=Penaeus monodon TaxID=6687 RepID=UPI0018A7B912|nr:uncharacterized protein LOC119586810 isoform X1 [Penaeus monodon]